MKFCVILGTRLKIVKWPECLFDKFKLPIVLPICTRTKKMLKEFDIRVLARIISDNISGLILRIIDIILSWDTQYVDGRSRGRLLKISIDSALVTRRMVWIHGILGDI